MKNNLIHAMVPMQGGLQSLYLRVIEGDNEHLLILTQGPDKGDEVRAEHVSDLDETAEDEFNEWCDDTVNAFLEGKNCTAFPCTDCFVNSIGTK